MKVYPQPELHFAEKEMATNLGEGNFIFVGSSTDSWANEVSSDWILRTLKHCRKYRDNLYLFQSKNPARFLMFLPFLPPEFILGTTIETNRDYGISYAPTPEARVNAMLELPKPQMVSIEPIMDFDLDILVNWIRDIRPSFISIGVDSKGHNLPEPSPEKLKHLVSKLDKITVIKFKSNLKRLLGKEVYNEWQCNLLQRMQGL